MTTSLLPNRERRHLLQFYIWPSLAYGPRLIVAMALIGVGVLAQAALPALQPPAAALTIAAIFAGNLFLLVKGYDLTPAQEAKKGAWEETTLERFLAVRELEQKVRRWDQTFADITCIPGFLALLLLGAALFLVFVSLAADRSTSGMAPFFAIDAAALILPHWLTGLRRGWRPIKLTQQINALETARDALQSYRTPAPEIKPMFEMAGEEDKRIPIGARLFARVPDAPADFIGVQFQVALNSVQGTNYPYLYAVIIAKTAFGLLDRPGTARIGDSQPRNVVVETESQSDVDVIVIRQKTTKTSGYHTRDAAIRDIAAFAWEAAAAILGKKK